MKMFQKTFILLSGLSLFVVQSLFVVGCSSPQDAEVEEELMIPDVNPFNGDAAAISEGKKIFAVKCSQCHGPDSSGGPEAPDLTDEESRYGNSDSDRFMIVWYGTPNNMPTWKTELGKENIWKVLAYTGSLKKERP